MSRVRLPAITLALACAPITLQALKSEFAMTTDTFKDVTVTTKANVYFDGKCVSHSFVQADGTKKSIGVILPSTLTFSTGAPEIMEGVGGACEYQLSGTTEWQKSGVGENFSVPANASFQIRVTGEPYSYICHFG